ncbi:hypothetical protein [Acinetobacter brisouii]|uniref:hypothetical protein n=1 Tax=Acinetobacter brisouii TaxID=396323 RepID=UPI0012502006|nr:hypothetical protein [Acinetobacter brisouii]
MWKKIRILILLSVLLVVAVNAWRDQNQNWDLPVLVLLHPVNADGQTTTEQYIRQLNIENFKDSQNFLAETSAAYRGKKVDFIYQLGRELPQIPPKVPENATALQAIVWSLKFRYYAWKQHQSSDGRPTVTLYLNYYDPQQTSALKHSTALEKGKIGSVNLFASTAQAAQNEVVVTHELLHTFGATDKYDLATGQPIYPLGYTQPEQQPLYPQRQAEIMGGYIALSATQNKMPDSLTQVGLNKATAIEVGWLK